MSELTAFVPVPAGGANVRSSTPGELMGNAGVFRRTMAIEFRELLEARVRTPVMARAWRPHHHRTSVKELSETLSTVIRQMK